MRTLEKKQRIRRVIYSVPSLIVLLIVTIFLVRGVFGILVKERESGKDSKNMKDEINTLVTRESELKERIHRLETEEGMQNEIRERFNVTQEGEFVAVIVDDRGISASTDDSMLPWYRKFLNVIISFYEY